MALNGSFAAADKVELTAKQSNIFVWGWQPNARHRVAVCGRRFGKTFLAAREIKRAAQLAAKRQIHPDNEIWYGAPTFKQAKRVFWQRMKRAIPKHWIRGKPNESECYITLKSGHVLRIVGLDNYDALRGSGLFFFIGDEWADAQPECWSEVIQPMLATCEGHSLRIGTPKGFNDLHRIFQLGQGNDGEYRSWIYTSLQGGNIPQHEIEKAKRDLDPRTFRQEYEASFETFAGQIIHSFVRAHNVRSCKFDETLPVHIGMDFNVNPMSATVWQEREDTVGGRKETISYQVGEIIIPTSNTDDMVAEIKNRYAVKGSIAHITIYPDPAGAQNRTSAQGKTDISILRGAGFKVLQMTSHPLVRDRYVTTNSRFCNAAGFRRAYIDPSCKKTIEALERFVYKDGTSLPDKDGGYDHPVDATGYYMFVRFGGTTAKKVTIQGF
jgi:hypothetical protein